MVCDRSIFLMEDVVMKIDGVDMEVGKKQKVKSASVRSQILSLSAIVLVSAFGLTGLTQGEKQAPKTRDSYRDIDGQVVDPLKDLESKAAKDGEDDFIKAEKAVKANEAGGVDDRLEKEVAKIREEEAKIRAKQQAEDRKQLEQDSKEYKSKLLKVSKEKKKLKKD